MRTLATVIAGLAGLIFVASTALAEDGAMIVLDASGSMAGQIGGKPKIDIARQTLATVLADSPEKLALGLIAYGHRQKTSCTDIDQLVPPTLGSAGSILLAAQGVKPLGKTPLAASINAAAQALNYEEQKATIILITDGADNCSGDPCALATDLKDTGKDITIHVIGFDLSEEAKASVTCLADTTGGLYLSADDASELAAALTKAVKIEPEIPLPPASVSGPASVEQGSQFKIAYDGPRAEGDQIQIAWPGSRPGQYLRNVLVTPDGKGAEFKAPNEPAVYELRYWLPSRGKVIAQAQIEITEAKPRLDGPAEVGQGTEFTVTWTGRHGPDDIVEIGQAGGDAIMSARVQSDTGEVHLNAPPDTGSYEVRYRGAGQASVTMPLAVTPIALSLDVPANVGGGTDFSVTWKGPNASHDEIQLASPQTPDGSRIASAGADDPEEQATFTAPLQGGTYELRYWSSRAKKVMARQSIGVSPAEAAIDAPQTVEGGARLVMSWKGPGARGDEIRLARTADPGTDAIARSGLAAEGTPITIAAPLEPGDYELRYWSGAWRGVLARKSLTVEAPDVALQPPPGTVSAGSRFAVGWKGPGGRYDDIRIAAVDAPASDAIHAAPLGEPGKPVELIAPETPGSYQLRYWSDSGRRVLATLPIEIR